MADKKSKKPQHQNLFVPGYTSAKPKREKKGKAKNKARVHSEPAPAPRPKAPAPEEKQAPESLYQQAQDGLFADAVAPKATPADAPPAALFDVETAAIEDDAPLPFGGEAIVEDTSGAIADTPTDTAAVEPPPAADEHAGEALAQGALFDDEDGMVLAGVAAPEPPPDPSPEKEAAAQAGAGKPAKGKKRKNKSLLEELQAINPWAKQEEGPSNAIPMPKRKKPRMSPAKRRRLFKRVRRAAFLAAVVAAIFLYADGFHHILAAYTAEAYHSARISLQGGDGFPMEFGLADTIKAEPMGEKGMFVLGYGEAAIVSSQGVQLRYIQHNYIDPGVSAGNNRAVLYSRGGTEYTVESRAKTLVKNTTEQPISFCTMSADGWLAVVTSSRYRANLQVYAPPYDTTDIPQLEVPLVDEQQNPLALAFHSDNKSMVLACLSASEGVVGTTLYLMRTDRDTVQTEIRADGAVLLQLEYLDNHRVLAVYDTYAATYNSRGQELNRYEYAHRRLVTSSIYDGKVALVFGTTSGEAVHTVLLDKSLVAQFDVSAETLTQPKVLATGSGVFLLSGQTLYAYTGNGALAARVEYDHKLLALAYAGTPLLLDSGGFSPIASLLRETPIEQAPSLQEDVGAPQSVSLPDSLPEGLYQSRPDAAEEEQGGEADGIDENGDGEVGEDGEIRDDPPQNTENTETSPEQDEP